MAVDIERVQARLLEMAKATAGILEKHDVPYIIIAGTLLGAVRHGGFIPWDDDFDFCLFDDSYDVAIEYLRAELPDSLFLEDAKSEPLFFHAWARVKDLNSVVERAAHPQDSCYTHQGLCVDLFRLEKMKLREVTDYQNAENRAYIERRRKLGLMDDIEYRERMERLTADEEWAKKRPYDSERDVFAAAAAPVFFEAGNVLPLKKYGFENTEFFGPADADKVLTALYGDYMALPPPERRKGHFSSARFMSGETKN